jgi:hypothetical protein
LREFFLRRRQRLFTPGQQPDPVAGRGKPLGGRAADAGGGAADHNDRWVSLIHCVHPINSLRLGRLWFRWMARGRVWRLARFPLIVKIRVGDGSGFLPAGIKTCTFMKPVAGDRTIARQ